MYISGQTLVHKTKRFLARLATKEDGTFAWNIGKKTGFILEDGTKMTDDINNYTNISDEFGNAYCGTVEKGQFVDISAKKYLVSEKELAKMKRKSLKQIKTDAKTFTDILIETLVTSINNGFSLNGFSFHCSKGEEGQILFFWPRQEYFKGFDYIEYLMDYLVKNKWRIEIVSITEFGKKRMECFTAKKNGKTIFWNCRMNNHIYSISPVKVRK